MKIQNIQPTNFQSKQYFITPKMKDNLKCLLARMNNEVKYSGNENCFKSTAVMGLKYMDKAELLDRRLFVGRIPYRLQMQGKTSFNIGKTHIEIDNSTGEITKLEKPFFISRKKIMKQLDKFLNIFLLQYNNEETVKKNILPTMGYTPIGWKRLNKLNADLRK